MRFIRFHTLIACWGLVGAGLLGTPSSATIAAAPDDIVLTRGTVITVTSVSDEVNGDVVDSRHDRTGRSTVARLIARPGPDGISLREAIEATNQDPGLYTIEFAPELAGLTISALPLPPLLSGGVTIDGDIDGDGEPDVTIRAASPTDPAAGLLVSSSDNTLNALELIGWNTGVALGAETPGATYANTTVANMVIRGVRDGITLGAAGWPADSRVTEHRWVNTRIIGNQIDATSQGVGVALAKTIGDVVEGLAISDNEIHIGGGTEQPAPAIGLMAGFWDSSSHNQIIDVDIANNTISSARGGAIGLTTGMVGASANLISDVRIEGNMIRDTNGGILVMANDASTTYHDPSYTPVAYPDDNLIRDIEILDNTIEWRGNIGIQITAGSPGNHNSVEDVRITGNELIGSVGPLSAISINTGGGNDTPEDPTHSVGNRVSTVRIDDNMIRVSGGPPGGPPQPHGAILLASGGVMTIEHQLSDVLVSGNKIEVSDNWIALPGILLHGGGHNTTGNQLTGVEVICNQITGNPEILMIGGEGPNASGNLIKEVVLNGNLTGDLLNNVSSQPNMEGATGNNVDWTVVDHIPADCPISEPSVPASEAQSEPTPGPATQDSANPVTETGPDSLEPWVWVVGAAVATGLVLSWVMLARRRKSLRRTN